MSRNLGFRLHPTLNLYLSLEIHAAHHIFSIPHTVIQFTSNGAEIKYKWPHILQNYGNKN